MEGPESAEYSGILSKKKLDHGRFEDPYKSKVQVWIRKNALYIRSLGPDKFPAPGSIPEKLDLAIWKVKINPHRFSGFQIEQFCWIIALNLVLHRTDGRQRGQRKILHGTSRRRFNKT